MARKAKGMPTLKGMNIVDMVAFSAGAVAGYSINNAMDFSGRTSSGLMQRTGMDVNSANTVASLLVILAGLGVSAAAGQIASGYLKRIIEGVGVGVALAELF